MADIEKLKQENEEMAKVLKGIGKLLFTHSMLAAKDGSPSVERHFREAAEKCFRAIPGDFSEVIAEFRFTKTGEAVQVIPPEQK